MDHFKRAAEGFNGNSPALIGHAQLHAQLANHELLTEIRDLLKAQQPMVVIDTPTPPQNDDAAIQMAFTDTEDVNDGMVVTPLRSGGWEFYSSYDDRTGVIITISQSDARQMARAILATKFMTDDE